ncbi:hypothetical protein DY000_02054866 [Brassica cretica]|uniref:Uncharacterized protein n=1 Tax=Brassica cretica TaxID=69181 RepID=A0ABQ7AK17_BRACR|nr:hypothetical protein DY000_02054866 [Brassica cretica]
MTDCLLHELRWIPQKREERQRGKRSSGEGGLRHSSCEALLHLQKLPGSGEGGLRHSSWEALLHLQKLPALGDWCPGDIECLTKRVEEAEQVIKGVPNLYKQIETLEAHVKILTGQVDSLTVQVANLKKLCFE